jgi:hypothetical protein
MSMPTAPKITLSDRPILRLKLAQPMTQPVAPIQAVEVAISPARIPDLALPVLNSKIGQPSDRKPIGETLDLLIAKYPRTFSHHADAVRPLMVGIYRPLIDAKLASGKAIRRALHSYVSTETYLRTLVAGTPRVDLAGEVVGQVSEREATHAVERLAKRKGVQK